MKKIIEILKYSGLKPLDFVAILFFVVLGSGLLVFNLTSRSSSPRLVGVVTRNLQEIERFELDKDRLIEIKDYGMVSIKSKKVRVLSANCRDQICVHTKEISMEGESIICLPNRVIVEIRSEQ